jgi:hypothetical protein
MAMSLWHNDIRACDRCTMRSASTGRRVRDEFISAGLTDERQVVPRSAVDV